MQDTLLAIGRLAMCDAKRRRPRPSDFDVSDIACAQRARTRRRLDGEVPRWKRKRADDDSLPRHRYDPHTRDPSLAKALHFFWLFLQTTFVFVLSFFPLKKNTNPLCQSGRALWRVCLPSQVDKKIACRVDRVSGA
nr:hypothetical protein [Pandoravirus massiliensis]